MKSYKNLFPFKIGTTSYIIHNKKENLIKNIEFLKESFDKIQLLYFGKNYLDEVMSKPILDRLKEIKKNSDVNYSIHLPLDLDLLNPDKIAVIQSLDIIESILEKTDSLDITNYILHIDRYSTDKYQAIIFNKENYELFENLLLKIKNKFKEKAKSIYIENISYDLIFFKNIILKNNFLICLDIGHLFIYKHDLDLFLECFKSNIKEVHLHGFNNKKDHISTKYIKKESLKQIRTFLRNYNESLVIEVFNKSYLTSSLKHLTKVL